MLSDRTLSHLREIVDLPDLTGTKYRLVRPIARGGMGTVHLVEDTELERKVALKVLSLPDPGGELTIRLFQEARLLAKLDHPNLVPVHDAGLLPDGRVYYVMKLVEGRTLDVWSEEGISRPTRLRVFQKICAAVAFAHVRGVLHRDLKPENILIDPFGEPFVMDWGLAKRIERGGDAVAPATAIPPPAPGETESTGPPATGLTTADGAVVGTPAYMAPEQATGRAGQLDGRTDVYALGGLLYFLLAGRPPVEGGTMEEVLDRVARGTIPPVRRLAPSVPKALESICAKAMSKQPADRYPTAAAMASDVDRFLDGLPVSAHRETVLEKAARLFRRNRTLAYLVLAYLVMRILVILWTGR